MGDANGGRSFALSVTVRRADFTGRLAISRCAIAVLPWLPTRDVNNERRERRRSAAGDDALL